MLTKRLVETADGLCVDYAPSLWQAARTLRLPGFSAEQVSPDLAAQTEWMNFPGVLACRDGVVLGVAGCSSEPDGTVSATLPVLTPFVSWKDQPAVVQALFDAIRQVALEQGAHGIHCLVPAGVDSTSGGITPASGTAQLMQYSGLSVVAEVVRMERAVSQALPEPSADARTHRAETPPSLAGEMLTVFLAEDLPAGGDPAAAMATALDVMLGDSLDLPPDIRPSAQQLLNVWRQRRSLVFCLGDLQNPSGLAAVSGPASEMSSMITLEYIGVRPDCRRQGRAQRLLEAVAQTDLTRLTSGAPAGSDGDRTSPVPLTLYSDARNVPAIALYRRCQYEEKEHYCLLYQRLEQGGPAAQLPDGGSSG